MPGFDPSKAFFVHFLLSSIAFFLLVQLTHADCECGYSATIDSATYLFTDLIESDFLHLSNISYDTDWIRQGYNVTAQVSRGAYGTSFELDNIASNPLVSNNSWAGQTVHGDGNPGLELRVRGGIPTDGFVPTAEMDSSRKDLLWGTYRAAMKLTDVPGTCGAFFWYFNDSQEIDMEFLSYEFDVEQQSFPINLVMQSSQSAAQGYQVLGNNYMVVNLPFNPTSGFHEYRIDFIPGVVIFYADSKILGSMNTSAVPTEPGHLILTHWSNGGSGWTHGPPLTNAVLAVSYVKSYFNSSLASRHNDLISRCKNPSAPNAVCTIPDQVIAPDPDAPNGNVTAKTFFFSDLNNSTNNQTVYRESEATSVRSVWSQRPVSLAFAILMLGMAAF